MSTTTIVVVLINGDDEVTPDGEVSKGKYVTTVIDNNN